MADFERDIARWRDVKAVHADVHALLRAGVLSKSPEGGVIFPYESIHVDFVLHAVA
jgi:predicted transcriptional regulator